jgi:hypothetical protein
MTYQELLQIDSGELARRRQLAVARRAREGERRALLVKFVDSRARADELRNWIAAYDQDLRDGSCPEMKRMLDWAKAELSELTASLEVGQLCAVLRDRKLFPALDELADPLGEPSPRHPWGR